MDTGRLAENVRRAAGAHLVSLDALAQHLGMTRSGLMKIVADDGAKRGLPSMPTIMKLSEAFAVDPRTLMADDPAELLTAVAESFERAPVRKAAKVPSPDLRPRLAASLGEGVNTATDAGAVPIERAAERKGRR